LEKVERRDHHQSEGVDGKTDEEQTEEHKTWHEDATTHKTTENIEKRRNGWMETRQGIVETSRATPC
jgi:hypothetical protein